MSFVFISLAVASLLFHVVVHEAAHALALRKTIGGDIQEAGLGLPLPPKWIFPANGRRSWRFAITPWLLGAYVKPSLESEHLITAAPYWQRAWFASAGVIVNVIVGFFALSLYAGYRGSWWVSVASTVAAVAVWLLRYAISYILPLFGIFALVLISIAINVDAPQGPVGLGLLFSEISTWQYLFVIFIAMAFGLAIFNCIPIYPLDGGHVMDAVLFDFAGERIASGYRGVSSFAFLTFVLWVLFTDVSTVFSWGA